MKTTFGLAAAILVAVTALAQPPEQVPDPVLPASSFTMTVGPDTLQVGCFEAGAAYTLDRDTLSIVTAENRADVTLIQGALLLVSGDYSFESRQVRIRRAGRLFAEATLVRTGDVDPAAAPQPAATPQPGVVPGTEPVAPPPPGAAPVAPPSERPLTTPSNRPKVKVQQR